MSTFTAEEALTMAAEIASGIFTSKARRWLAQGMNVWTRNDGEVRLERCLKLACASKRLALARRDSAILRAAQYVEGKSAWAKAVNLRAALAEFQQKIWPAWSARYQDSAPDPETTSRLNFELFEILKSGAEIPKTTEGFYGIVKRGDY